MDVRAIRSKKTWGCPTYVLDSTLQDGKKLPKWDPRIRREQYMGRSLNHARSISLIRNLDTWFILPQFHVIYDHQLQTVSRGMNVMIQ